VNNGAQAEAKHETSIQHSGLIHIIKPSETNFEFERRLNNHTNPQDENNLLNVT
jgi:hypothetical protein